MIINYNRRNPKSLNRVGVCLKFNYHETLDNESDAIV
jgi:hypothetical protein